MWKGGWEQGGKEGQGRKKKGSKVERKGGDQGGKEGWRRVVRREKQDGKAGWRRVVS